MSNENDLKTAKVIASRANDYLERYQTPPNPKNYEIFYVYAAGTKHALNLQLDRLPSTTSQLTSRDTDELYQEHLSDLGIARKLEEIGKGLGR